MKDQLPTHYSLLVAGPPGVGKFEFFLDLARQYLDAGEKVVFVTLDLHPDEVRKRAEALGCDLPSHEGTRCAFVDCYSAVASERGLDTGDRKVYLVTSFSNLEGLGMAISRAANDLGAPVRIFVYTVSTLFLHNSSQTIAKFVQIITGRVRTNIGFVAYAMHEGVHDPMTVNLLRSLVDGVVELRFSEAMDREVRIHHLRGIPIRPEWKPLAVEGLAFAPPGEGGGG